MKPIVILSALLIITGCHNHNHHHESTEAHKHETHEHHHEAEAHNHEAHGHGSEIVIEPHQAAELGIISEEVSPKDFQMSIRTSGTITAASQGEIAITAKSNGILSWAAGKPIPGTRVQKGEIIANISSDGLVEGNSLNKAQNNYELAKKEYERAKQLHEAKIISEKEFLQIENEYKNARNAANNLSSKGLAITCPSNASIQSVFKNEGEFVAEGETIAILIQNKKAILKANLPQKYSKLNISEADFKVNETIYNTKSLKSISNTLEGPYLPLYFEFENEDNIPQGSYAEVWLISDTKPNTIAIPLTALIEDQADYCVYIQLDEECYAKRRVSLGQRNSSEVEVLGGLEIGEKVVTKGAFQVKLSKAAIIPGHSHNH